MILSEHEAETRGLVARLRHDASVSDAQAEHYERDAKQLIERAERKRSLARMWRGAAAKLEELLSSELQEREDAREEGEEDVSTETH